MLTICFKYYYRLRTSLTTSELILTRALGYNLDVDLPFTFALKVLKGMGCVPVFMDDESDRRLWQTDISRNGRSASDGHPDKKVLQNAIKQYFEEDLDVDLALVARLTWVYAWDRYVEIRMATMWFIHIYNNNRQISL
jgi:hypothetical protein